MRRGIDLTKLIEKEKEENTKLFSNLSKSGIEYSTMEKILMSKMTKYTVLDSLIPSMDDKTVVNIAIDINSLINTLYNPTMADSLNEFVCKRANKSLLASYLLNIVGHYKNFFIAKRQKAVQVFMYYSFKDLFQGTIKTTFLEKYSSSKYTALNNYIVDELNTVKEVLRFVPYCYMIDTGIMSSDLVPMLIEKDNSGVEQTILVTNNKLSAINMSMSDNISILDVKGVDSGYYTNDNINEFIAVKTESVEVLRDNLLRFFSIVGFSKYDIDKVAKVTSKKLIELFQDEESYMELAKKNKDAVNKNLSFLNFQNRVSHLGIEEITSNFYSHIIDFEIDDRESLNSDFFNKYPLNLDFLFRE